MIQLGSLVLLAGCHSTSRATGGVPPVTTKDASSSRGQLAVPMGDVLASYRRGGFLVGGGDVPFIGSIGFLAGPTADSTLAVIAFSMANRALTFTRDGERYRAAYDVVVEIRRGDALVRRELAHENVRVGTFKETSREEESVIFQQFVLVPPGTLSVSVSARDAGSTRTGTARTTLVAPRFDGDAIAAPVAVFRARARKARDARPELVMSPRATLVFGRDSTAEFYVERYGAPTADGPSRALFNVFDDSEHAMYADTIAFTGGGAALRSATVRVPGARIGFGVLSVAVSEIGEQPSGDGRAVARTPLLVTFGEGLAVSSFDQMLGYLRFFTTAERLRMLRDTTPEDRPRAWAAFLAATDPMPSTSENEALRDYLGRVADANARFAEESVAGWLSDRGMIFAALGEPDNRVEPNGGDPTQRTRVQVWEYQRYRARFVFVDQTGFGRWRLTPSSEAEYHALVRRLIR